MFKTIKEDIKNVFDRDPALKSNLEAFLCYPGLHAIWGHRLSHFLYINKFYILARIVSNLIRFFTGIEIHPGAKIGKRVFIDHGMGVVIGETSIIGDGCLIYKGVVLGGTNLNKTKRHPTLGRNVVVGTNATILGNIRIGRNVRIGANSVVLKNVPSNSTVVGVPGKIIKTKKPDNILEHDKMPDPMTDMIKYLFKELKMVEDEIHLEKKELKK
jgi:serine O-acetyltransferase